MRRKTSSNFPFLRADFRCRQMGWRWPQLVSVLVGRRPWISKSVIRTWQNCQRQNWPQHNDQLGRQDWIITGGLALKKGNWYGTRPPAALITDVCVSQLTAHLWSAGHSGPAQSRGGERTFCRDAERNAETHKPQCSLANGNQRSRGWAPTSQNATCQFVPFHSWAHSHFSPFPHAPLLWRIGRSTVGGNTLRET